MKSGIGIALVLAASLQGASAQEDRDAPAMGLPIEIHLDMARIVKLPERTATLVVGNPLIADVSVQPGSLLVVTGKGYGVTNVIALDRSGQLLMEHPIKVMEPRDRVVTVFRGVERETYSCESNCARRVTLGDSPTFFTQSLSTAGAWNAQAQQPSAGQR